MKEATEMGGSDDEKDEWREWRGERERERERKRERDRERAVGEPLWILMCAQVVVDRAHTAGSLRQIISYPLAYCISL